MITGHDLNRNIYTTIKVPDNIDGMLDHMTNEYDLFGFHPMDIGGQYTALQAW